MSAPMSPSISAPVPFSAPIIPPFLEGLIRLLMPYFLPTCPDMDIARIEILETLSSYGARSRLEVINAARIIAYSYAAMETLAGAFAPDLSRAMRLRQNSSANALGRSCLQNEKILEKRLAAALPDAEPTQAALPEEALPEAALREAALSEAALPQAALIDNLPNAIFLAARQAAASNVATRPDSLPTSPTPNPTARSDSSNAGRIPNTGDSPHQATKDTSAGLGISANDTAAVERATQLAASSHLRGV